MQKSIEIESTLSSKGQVTLPKAIRDILDVQTGAKIVFTTLPDGEVKLSKKEQETKNESFEFISDQLFNDKFSSLNKEFETVFRNLVEK